MGSSLQLITKLLVCGLLVISVVGQYDPNFEPDTVYCQYGDKLYRNGEEWTTSCFVYQCTREGALQTLKVTCPDELPPEESPNCPTPFLNATDSINSCCTKRYFCPNLPINSEGKTSTYGCPDGWLPVNASSESWLVGSFGVHCAKYYDQRLSWNEARLECRSHSSWLIDWDSIQYGITDFDELHPLFNSHARGDDYWIGLHISERGQLAFDGRSIEIPLSTTNNSLCEASRGAGSIAGWGCDLDSQWLHPPEDLCFSAKLNLTELNPDYGSGSINASIYQPASCRDRKPFVCLLSPEDKSFQLHSDSRLCQLGWLWSPYARLCVNYIMSGKSLNFPSASKNCEENGGQLYRPDTKEKRFLLYEIMRQREPKPESVWVSTEESSNTTNCVRFSNPYLIGSILSDHLMVVSCLQSLPYICETGEHKEEINTTKVDLVAGITLPTAPPPTASTTTVFTPTVPTSNWTDYDCTSNDKTIKNDSISLIDPSNQLKSAPKIFFPPVGSEEIGKYRCSVYSPEARRVIYSKYEIFQDPAVLNVIATFEVSNTEYSGLMNLWRYMYSLPFDNFLESQPLILNVIMVVEDQIQEALLRTIEMIYSSCQCANSVVNNDTQAHQRVTAMRKGSNGVVVDAYVTFYHEESRRVVNASGGSDNETLRADQTDLWDNFRVHFAEALKKQTNQPQTVRLQATDQCYAMNISIPSIGWLSLPSGTSGQKFNFSSCGSTGLPLVMAHCVILDSGGVEWDYQDFDCPAARESTRELAKVSVMAVARDNFLNISEDLNRLTSEVDELNVDEISYISQIFRSLVNAASYLQREQDVKTFLMDVTKTLSQVVTSDAADVVTAQTNTQSSERILTSLEDLTQFVLTSTQLLPGDNNSDLFNAVTPGIAIKMTRSVRVFGVVSLDQDITSETITYLDSYSNSTQLSQDKNVGLYVRTDLAEDSAKQFTVYKNSNLFIRTREDGEGSGLTAGGRIISATLLDSAGMIVSQKKTSYPNLVTIHYPEVRSGSLSPVCGFWDMKVAVWSTEGCETSVSDVGVICTCNHLTDFSVLLDIHREDADLSPTVHRKVLSIISLSGLSISIVALSLVIVTGALNRKMSKTDSQKVLLCLALCLFALNVTFVVGASQSGNFVGCLLSAIFIHYFLLASFAWMLIEAIVLYLRSVKVLGGDIPNFMLKVILSASIIPLVIVAVVLAVDYKLYVSEDPDVCWMAREAIFYSVLIPIGLVIFVNLIVFIMVMHGLTCGRSKVNLRSNQPERNLALLHLKASVTFFVILGITWIFGFLALIPRSTVYFQYIFCICNSLQGLVIFFVHNTREKLARQEWRRFLRCAKQSESITSNSNARKNYNNSNVNVFGSQVTKHSAQSQTSGRTVISVSANAHATFRVSGEHEPATSASKNVVTLM